MVLSFSLLFFLWLISLLWKALMMKWWSCRQEFCVNLTHVTDCGWGVFNPLFKLQSGFFQVSLEPAIWLISAETRWGGEWKWIWESCTNVTVAPSVLRLSDILDFSRISDSSSDEKAHLKVTDLQANSTLAARLKSTKQTPLELQPTAGHDVTSCTSGLLLKV